MKTAYTHPESRREVVLPDGFVMSREEAESKGYTIASWPYAKQGRVAARHPHRDVLVVLEHGVTVNEGTARALGYKIGEQAQVYTAAAPLSPQRAWRAAILTSSEANDRPDAAVELVTKHTEATMSVDAARAFLRGLPVEQTLSAPATVRPTANPRAERLAEIGRNMAAFNRNNGHAPKEATDAVSPESIEPAKLKRLAEIMLGVLTMRMSQGDTAVSKEHKKLQYAMSVHNQTGVRLAEVFKQLSVDTSKMLSNAR